MPHELGRLSMNITINPVTIIVNLSCASRIMNDIDRYYYQPCSGMASLSWGCTSQVGKDINECGSRVTFCGRHFVVMYVSGLVVYWLGFGE
jgi:hypothetical protein